MLRYLPTIPTPLNIPSVFFFRRNQKGSGSCRQVCGARGVDLYNLEMNFYKSVGARFYREINRGNAIH